MTSPAFDPGDYVRGTTPDGRTFEGVVSALREYHHVEPVPGPEWDLLVRPTPYDPYRTIAWHPPHPPPPPKTAIEEWEAARGEALIEYDDGWDYNAVVRDAGDRLASELATMRDLVERALPIVKELGHEWGYDYADKWFDDAAKTLGDSR